MFACPFFFSLVCKLLLSACNYRHARRSFLAMECVLRARHVCFFTRHMPTILHMYINMYVFYACNDTPLQRAVLTFAFVVITSFGLVGPEIRIKILKCVFRLFRQLKISSEMASLILYSHSVEGDKRDPLTSRFNPDAISLSDFCHKDGRSEVTSTHCPFASQTLKTGIEHVRLSSILYVSAFRTVFRWSIINLDKCFVME